MEHTEQSEGGVINIHTMHCVIIVQIIIDTVVNSFFSFGFHLTVVVN